MATVIVLNNGFKPSDHSRSSCRALYINCLSLTAQLKSWARRTTSTSRNRDGLSSKEIHWDINIQVTVTDTFLGDPVPGIGASMIGLSQTLYSSSTGEEPTINCAGEIPAWAKRARQEYHTGGEPIHTPRRRVAPAPPAGERAQGIQKNAREQKHEVSHGLGKEGSEPSS